MGLCKCSKPVLTPPSTLLKAAWFSVTKSPEKLLLDWLEEKPERTEKPCIVYLYRKVPGKRCIERVPIHNRVHTQNIANKVVERMAKMKKTLGNRAIPSQEFIAVAVHVGRAISCWTGQKWVKTVNLSGDRRRLKDNRGRIALLMLMEEI